MNQKSGGDLLTYFLGIGSVEIDAAGLEQLSSADWDEVIQQSANHGVAPILYHRLKESSIANHIPTEVMQKLRAAYLNSAERNMRMLHELSKVLRKLQDEGIPVIVLKGAALAELVYRNIALRIMFDTDILVKNEDIWRIDDILSKMGYRSDMACALLSKRHIQWTRHVAYMSRSLQIEAHFKVDGIPELDPWIKAAPATVAFVDTLILGPADFLLHLCVHLLDHLCVRRENLRLIWWFDIAEMLKYYQNEIDWDYVIRIVKKCHIDTAIYRVLYLINEHFGNYVPLNVLSQIKVDGDIVSFNDLMNQKQTQNLKADSLLSYYIPPNITSFQDKIYHIIRSIFPCRDYMMYHYSVKRPKRVYFYYFIRMAKGVVKVVKALLQLPRYVKNRTPLSPKNPR